MPRPKKAKASKKRDVGIVTYEALRIPVFLSRGGAGNIDTRVSYLNRYRSWQVSRPKEVKA